MHAKTQVFREVFEHSKHPPVYVPGCDSLAIIICMTTGVIHGVMIARLVINGFSLIVLLLYQRLTRCSGCLPSIIYLNVYFFIVVSLLCVIL